MSLRDEVLDEESKKGKKQSDLTNTGDDTVSDSFLPKNESAIQSDASKRWPESEGSRFQQVFKSWTYSYMRPLMQKGRRQFLDGHHLTKADLFDVPDEMKANGLVKSFRCVLSRPASLHERHSLNYFREYIIIHFPEHFTQQKMVNYSRPWPRWSHQRLFQLGSWSWPM